MKILIVSSYLPYPLYSGGSVRLFNLIKQLSENHEITLICERRPQQTEKDIKEVEKICHKVLTVNRKKQWSISNIVKAGFSMQPFLLVGHTLSEMQIIIGEELQGNTYDLIHIETFYVMQNLPSTSLPVLLVEHNIEYKVYERFAENASFFLKPLLFWDAYKIKRAEKAAWKRATKVATVSENDKDIIGRSDTEVIANGVDLENFKFKNVNLKHKKTDKRILYIGDFKWIQNTDAAKYIITKVWPEVQRKFTQNVNTKLWIIGRNMPESLKALGKNDPRIIFDDNNQQPTPEIFSEADILLAPKRVGGGTSYKTLESMAVGTPVVTTSLGLEGLEIRKGEDILVADSAEEIAEHVITLLTNTALSRQLSVSGRKRIEERYSWNIIAAKLEKLYASLMQSS